MLDIRENWNKSPKRCSHYEKLAVLLVRILLQNPKGIFHWGSKNIREIDDIVIKTLQAGPDLVGASDYIPQSSENAGAWG